MLTALPPKTATAIEDDRPIVVGRVAEMDFYLMAHEAKNQGYHTRAVMHLMVAAVLLNVPYVSSEGPLSDWDLNIRVIDEAWGRAQKRHGN